MKMQTYKLTILFATSLLLSACGADISDSLDDSADPGTADFTTFVTVGDSLTAGYADGALYRHGQENSFPSILAQQLARAGGGTFSQPLMPVGATGSLTHSTVDLGRADRLLLEPTGNPSQPAAPGTILTVQSTAIDVRVGTGGFNNMGIPGAKAIHLNVPGYGENSLAAFVGGTANPYFARFSSGDATTVMTDFFAQAPTFFILWIGSNDVLLYAVDGGPGSTPGYGTGPTDVTDPALFEAAYNGTIAAITANLPTAKGVLVTVPDVGNIPYFTTVPYNPIPMDAITAAGANAAYQTYNDGLLAAEAGTLIDADERQQRTISFAAGQNALVILDESLTPIPGAPPLRQATANDLIILTASTKIGTPSDPLNPLTTIWGVGTPMDDADVLTETEYAFVLAARDEYNADIVAAANANPNFALFDAAALLEELNDTGILYGSGGISATFAQGGGFSLDGIHPTARGYAVMANELMKVIESAFGAKLPPVDPNQYTTVFYQ